MKLSNLALAIVAAGLAGQASASGFALDQQSVSAMGTSNAGRTSNAQDASVVFNNPALMMKIKGPEFTQALSIIDAKSQITAGPPPSPNPGFNGSNEGDMVPFTMVPSGYYTSGNKGNYAWGIAAYGSYGLKTNYEPTFQGRTLGLTSSLRVITIQPAISFKLTDKVTFGFGPTFNRLDANLTKNVSPSLGGPGNVTLKGDEMAYGFNAGLSADLTKDTQVGLVYRSQQNYHFKDATFNTSTFGYSRGETKIALPQSVDFGISHRISDTTQIHAGALWTRWSRLQQLAITNTNPVPAAPALQNPVEPFHWKDSTAYAVGVTHDYSDKLQLRAGFAYDQSPVTEANAGVRVPSADRFITSVGAGYKFNQKQSIDMSYNYLQEQSYQVNQPTYKAKYENRANIFGLQFNQKF